tara:strand:+ start:5107 stop:5910 length:804 start_codon:yes stop_codon:yes gene_type:complete
MTTYSIYLIIDNKTSDKELFITKCDKVRAIYNLKQVKTETKIKSIILKNDYILKLIKSYTDVDKEIVKRELIDWKNHHEEIDEINARVFVKNNTLQLHTDTRNKCLEYGLKNEMVILNNLNKFNTFNMNLRKSLYSKTKFDYIGDDYLFEVKSLTYSVDKYNTAIMNIDKLLDTDYNNFVFIFEYTEDNGERGLFYHVYNTEIIYNRRFITAKNRLNKCDVIDIPITELIKIDYEVKINLPKITNNSDIVNFESVVKTDEVMFEYFN